MKLEDFGHTPRLDWLLESNRSPHSEKPLEMLFGAADLIDLPASIRQATQILPVPTSPQERRHCQAAQPRCTVIEARQVGEHCAGGIETPRPGQLVHP